MYTAYCYQSGLIEFTDGAVPEGALPIVSGEKQDVIDLITATARHSRTDTTLLVPGVPEAENDDAAIDALLRFIDWIGRREIENSGAALSFGGRASG